MKIFKIGGLLLTVVFVCIQFFSTERNESSLLLATDIDVVYEVPFEVKRVFKTSCYDCHSNNTAYPWYNKIQPVAWLLENHIKKGKAELNFSEFGSYSIRRQRSKLRSIEGQIVDDKMPLRSYTLIHRKARLSKNDKMVVVEWVVKLRDSLK